MEDLREVMFERKTQPLEAELHALVRIAEKRVLIRINDLAKPLLFAA